MTLEPTSVQLCNRCQAKIVVKGRPPAPVNRDQLRSVYIPNDTETCSIQHLIEDAQSDLDSYNTEINNLKNTLDQLSSRRDELQGYINEYKSFISPVRRLPVEILREIFRYTSKLDLLQHEDLHVPTLSASQTCMLWRNVLTSVPQFWSDISANLRLLQLPLARLVDLYLHRSSPTPLTLRITARTPHPTDELANRLTSHQWSTVRSLLLQSYRWQSVSFDLHSEIFLDMADSIKDLDWISRRGREEKRENFRSLSLKWETQDGFDDPYIEYNKFFHILKYSPNLQVLDIQNYSIYYPFHVGSLSTVVVASVKQLESIFHLLKTCTKLLHADFTLFNPVDMDIYSMTPPPSALVTSMTLRTLKITFQWSDDASKTLCALTLPNLTKLEIRGPVFESDDHIWASWVQIFQDFLHKSPHLSELYLGGDPVFHSEQELFQILRIQPNLTHLGLDVKYYHRIALTNNVLRGLSFQRPMHSSSGFSTMLLPHLTHLNIGFMDGVFQGEENLPDADDILSVVQSRVFHADGVGDGEVGDPSLTKLQVFELSVSLNSPKVGLAWEEKFLRMIEQRLKVLRKHGLESNLHIERNYD